MINKQIKHLPAILLLTLTPLVAAAQKNENLKKKANEAESFIAQMARSNYDSTYVTLPEHKWMVFTSGNGNYSKYNLRVPMPNIMEEWGEEMLAEYPMLKDMDLYTYDMDLHNSTQSVSIGLAYRTLRAKYTFNVSKGNDHQFSFETLGTRFGFMFDYRQTKKMKGDMYDVKKGFNYLVRNLYAGGQSASDVIDAGTGPIDERYNNYTLIHLQAHYVFNYKHFSYSAGRSASRIQKKSAGSPLALIDFYQSQAKFEKEFIIGTDERFKTWKLSLGGGYGYNLTPNAGKVLLHASVIPSVTLFSHSNYRTTIPDDKPLYKENVEYVNDMVDATPKITLNCTARFAATWNIDSHYVLGAYGTYLYSHFANKQDYRIDEHYLSGSVYLGYRF